MNFKDYNVAGVVSEGSSILQPSFSLHVLVCCLISFVFCSFQWCEIQTINRQLSCTKISLSSSPTSNHQRPVSVLGSNLHPLFWLGPFREIDFHANGCLQAASVKPGVISCYTVVLFYFLTLLFFVLTVTCWEPGTV